jgi:hypothetical protein
MATIREYTIKVNPVLGLVDAPKKMYFYRSDVETSSLKILSTAELPNATVSLTCIKKSTNSIVTMTGTVDPLNNVSFTLLLLSQFTSTSDTLNCELKITQDGKKVTTFPNFNIIVNPSIVDGIEGGQDPTEETTLSNLIDEVNDILNKLNNGGVDGRGIKSITKTSTDGLVDTYTILYTDNTTSTFTVTNGAKGSDGVGIQSVTKTSTEGLVDTYTITLTNGTKTTFTVTNGKDGRGITDISKTKTEGLVDTYTITYTDNTTSTFTVTNGADGGGGGGTGTDGRGIVSITKTDTEGLVDTYTITYTDNTTSTFSVTNGKDGQKGADGRGITSITKTKTEGLVDTYTINYTDNTTSEFSVTNGADGTGGGGGSADVPLIAKGYFDYTKDFKDTSKFKAQVRSQNTKSLTNLPDGNTTSRQAVETEYTGDLLALWQQTKRFYLVASFVSNNSASHSSVGTKEKSRPLWIKLEYRIVIQNSDGSYALKGNASNPGQADIGYFETAILPKQQTFKDSGAGYNFVLVFDNTDNNINLMGAPVINNIKGTSASASYDFHNHEFITFGGLKPIISELPYASSVSYVGIVPYKLTCYFYEEGETEVADVSNTNKTKVEMYTEVTT